MINVPSALEQKKTIESYLKQPISEECYMISKRWWDNWMNYVLANEKDMLPLEAISNLDLM